MGSEMCIRDSRSVINSTDCIERTVVRTSVSSATLDSYCTSSCQTADDGQTQPVYAKFGSRSSASPQLQRWNGHPESGGHNSSATQVGSTEHHHYQFQQHQPDDTTKPHSVPCSPRLQARLAATQPWRPWSPSKSDSPTSMDITQLASTLLLTNVIRNRQDPKSTGKYTGQGRTQGVGNKGDAPPTGVCKCSRPTDLPTYSERSYAKHARKIVCEVQKSVQLPNPHHGLCLDLAGGPASRTPSSFADNFWIRL